MPVLIGVRDENDGGRGGDMCEIRCAHKLLKDVAQVVDMDGTNSE